MKAPRGKAVLSPLNRVEIAILAVVQFEGDKLAHEHFYWDQPSVLRIDFWSRQVCRS
jgi:hypothetical protein